MAGPWEKYQAKPAAGPWAKYQSAPPAPQEPAKPAATPEPWDARGPTGVPGGTTATPPVAEPGADAMTSAAFIGQQADRGLADVIGAPVDLTALALNLGLGGSDFIAELFGGNVDARVTEPIMGSDWIARNVASLYEEAGGTVVAPEDVSRGVRTAGAAARGAGATVIPAMGLASAPVQTVARNAAAKAGKAAAQGNATPLDRAGALLDVFAKPYGANAGSTLAADIAAGAGAGASAQAVDEYAPQSVQDSFAGPLIKAGAALAGGVGGAGVSNFVEGASRGAVGKVRNLAVGAGDPNAPVNPATGKPFTRTEMDRAAWVAQQMPSNQSQAVANIDEAMRDFGRFANDTEMPTTGMLADDIGMAIQENILRARDPQRFAERDNARRSLASRRVDASAPKGADGRNFTNEATRQYDETLDTAANMVDDATARQAAAQADLQRQNLELEDYRARQPQVSAAMADDFDAARRAGREAKNARYDAADPATPVDGRFLTEAVERIEADMPNAERIAGGPYSEIAARVRQVAEGEVTYGDVKALRAQISEARKAAVSASGQSVAGSGADVQRLDQLGRVLGKLADDINPEASRFYSEEYAPRFKTGKAGEYGAAMDRASRTGGESSATRPSEFGDKFLRKPEDAASFRRAMTPMAGDSGPAIAGPEGSTAAAANVLDPKTIENARDWMLGDLAKSGVLTDNAELRYDRFKQWADRNRGTIDQFPEIADTVNAELAEAQRGGALSKQLAADVADAKRNLKTTTAELRSSALQSVIGKNPANAVSGIMESGDPERQMADMVRRLAGNTDATEGLKAGVRDWIKTKAGLTSKIVGDPDAVRLSRSKMESLFQRHEDILASIYSPEEMNALRQAHKLMGAEANLDVRTTAGSNTVDKLAAQAKADITQRKRVLEGALKAKFGVLKGGGIFRTMNLFLESLPDGNRGLEDILFEMQFNPELAKHLLTRPVKEVGSPGWNSKLNQLMAVATGARESTEER